MSSAESSLEHHPVDAVDALLATAARDAREARRLASAAADLRGTAERVLDMWRYMGAKYYTHIKFSMSIRNFNLQI